MLSALVVAQVIRPGGGPGGYVWNLEQGYRKVPAEDRPRIALSFAGSRDVRSAPSHAGAKFRFLTATRNLLEITHLRKPLLQVRFLFSKSYKDLRSKILQNEVIVFHGPFFLDLLRFANKNGKKTIYMPHSPLIYADEYRDTLKLSGIRLPKASYNTRFQDEKNCIDEANVVVFPSPGASRVYLEEFGITERSRIRYLVSGIDISSSDKLEPAIDNLVPIDSSAPKVLFAGRYVDHKGYRDFCEAAEQAARKGIRANFCSAGVGPIKPTKSVEDLGWRSDIHDLVRHAQIVAIPNRVSYYDLFPLECAALGKPMIMSRVGGNIDQAMSLPDTVTYNPSEPGAFLEAVEQALRRLDVDPFWGRQNQTAYNAQFTADAFCRRWMSLLTTDL